MGSAIVFGWSPEHAVPANAFWSSAVAAALVAVGLTISRRRAAIALLCVVFLLGCWLGGDAIKDVGQTFQYNPSVRVSNVSTYSSKHDPLSRFRSSIANELTVALGATDAGLPIALLTGDRSLVNTEVTNDFRSAGLAHLLAISGLHVSLVGGLAMASSVFVFGRRRAAYLLIPVVCILLYAAIAGFAPPITRAAIMFSVFILGRFMGRGSHTLAALALAGMLMVAWEPAILASLSFQLSFAAMLGISFVAPVLDSMIELSATERTEAGPYKLLERARRFVVGSLIISFASTVATLPLVALHFNEVPIWGALATLLALPAVPILIVTSGLVAAVGISSLPLISGVVSLPADFSINYLTSIAHFFAHLPPGPFETDTWSAWMVCAYYSVLATLITVWQYGKSRGEQIGGIPFVSKLHAHALGSLSLSTQLAVSAILLLAGAALWWATFLGSDSSSHLTVSFLQTSHGESIFIETPNGNRMLVDGGGNAREIADRLSSLMLPWDREINLVMLTHSDTDHVGGLPEVLKRFRVETILHSGMDASSDAFSAWSQAIDGHYESVVVWEHMTIGLDSNVYLEVISAGCIDTTVACADANNASIVSVLRYGDISFLLTGDIERTSEARLATSVADLHATVLKAPHHGSITSSTSIFLDAVKPSAVVVAAGTDNRYGHPHPEVMARLNMAVGHERVLRTDLLGSVVLRTDGERLWMVR